MRYTKVLSIFVDESGDFGPYDYHCPFYIFTLVFHDQDNSIIENLQKLDQTFRDSGLGASHCFHAGPVIRREEDYQFMDIPERRRIMGKMLGFARNVDISYISFYVEKKTAPDSVILSACLSKELSRFIRDNYSYFTGYDSIIIYYDNGQVELGRILASIFTAMLTNVEYRRVLPAEYRLFQVADLLCTLELVRLKAERTILSKSEKSFFGSMRDMKKNYFKIIDRIKYSKK